MLISVEELKRIYNIDLNGSSDELIERKLEAIELSIRNYTNNNFQNRNNRGYFKAVNNVLSSKDFMILKKGDTVQISASKYNNGLYVVESYEDGVLMLNKPVYDSDILMVTKIEYPIDIIDGAIKILDWDLHGRDKVGIASESISRHSVTYQQYDGTNTINGYPSALYGFCKAYMRARV